MTDEPSIPPALTAEEWAEWAHAQESHRSVLDFAVMNDEGYIRPMTPDRSHAIAALSLYGQPFGFTQEDLAVLERAASVLEWYDAEHPPLSDDPQDAGGLRCLSRRIAALLPPA